MDSQRWQQERQPGEAGRGGSHSPHVRTTKVSRGPDASLVAYQDSRTHAARQHWGPTKPYEHATAEAYSEPPSRGSTASRATYASSSAGGYASSDSPHYTTSSAVPYGSSHPHPGYQPSSVSATPRNPPSDPYSAYQQQPSRGDSRSDYPAQSGYSYPAQASADPYGGRQAAPSATSYATPSGSYATTGQYAAPRYFGYYDDPFLVYR